MNMETDRIGAGRADVDERISGSEARRENWPVEHPARYALTNELHARPFEQLSGPVQLSMYAMLTGEGRGDADLKHLKALCGRFGVNPPQATANHFSADFGQFRLRWERHTEFTSYTLIRTSRVGSVQDAFTRPASIHAPKDWLSELPGKLLVATHLTVLAANDPDPTPEDLSTLFVTESLVTSALSDSGAHFWTDLRIHPDGHNRILVKDHGMPAPKAGRLIQRLLEIATYRNLALLALPLAREVGPKLAEIDRDLSNLTGEMASVAGGARNDGTGSGGAEKDGELLERLTRLSADIEQIASETSYRFSAAKAYFALIQARLKEIRECRQDGFQNLSEFLDRRLSPAIRTCEAVSDRQADLSRRATRAANLLRTRVDFVLERQNQGLLSSMDRRAKLQLRLQETVEGLSVAAITYYAVGLVRYAAKATSEAGIPVPIDLVTGVSVPVIAGAVYFGMRRVRKHLDGA